MFNPWVEKIPWRRKWLSTPVFLSGEFHGQRSLAGYSLRGLTESDMNEQPIWASLVAQIVNYLPAMSETWIQYVIKIFA